MSLSEMCQSSSAPSVQNRKGTHSFSLESYLIKPIQRILKYPLLLQQLKQLTDPVTEEHQHLAESLKGRTIEFGRHFFLAPTETKL